MTNNNTSSPIRATPTTEVFEIEDEHEPGFSMVYHELLDVFGPAIGSSGIAIYVTLKRWAYSTTNKCCPSLANIATKSQTSKSTVQRYLRLFESLGLIERRSRVSENGGDTTKLIVLKNIKRAAEIYVESEHVDTSRVVTVTTPHSHHDHGGVVTVTTKEDVVLKKKDSKKNPTTLDVPSSSEHTTSNAKSHPVQAHEETSPVAQIRARMTDQALRATGDAKSRANWWMLAGVYLDNSLCATWDNCIEELRRGSKILNRGAWLTKAFQRELSARGLGWPSRASAEDAEEIEKARAWLLSLPEDTGT